MVKELGITLNPGPQEGHYSPGSTITGSLMIKVDKPKKYKALEVCLLGTGRVRWSQGSGDKRRTYSASEVYVSEKLILWRSEDSPNGTFPVGRHTYPFQFVLPPTCPSSYISQIGNISYEIEGSISTGLFKFDHKVKHPLTVSEVVSVAPSAGVRFERRKKVGCGLCVSGEITYNLQLPSTSFTIGEEIPVSWYVENGSGRQVTLQCSLREKITYLARGRSRGNIIILSAQSDLAIPPRSVRDTTICVPVPPCRPAMTRSNIIRSEFLLVATVVIPWANDSNNVLPVTIGNTSILQREPRTIY